MFPFLTEIEMLKYELSFNDFLDNSGTLFYVRPETGRTSGAPNNNPTDAAVIFEPPPLVFAAFWAGPKALNKISALF